MRFLLYHHKNRVLSEYVKKFSILSDFDRDESYNVEILSLPQQNNHDDFAELPESIRRLLFFAKPDLVICFDDDKNPIKPIFAFEHTQHVPARDHWMQRFVNLVGCAQEGIPGAYIIPFSMQNRPNFTGVIDSVFFFAYDRIMDIHKIPFYIAEWETADGQTLKPDLEFPFMPDHTSKDIKNAFLFLNLVIKAAIQENDFRNLMSDRLIVDLRIQIRGIAYKSIPKISDFKRLSQNMPNDNFLINSELETWLDRKGMSLPPHLPDRIIKRNKNLIFAPQLYDEESRSEVRLKLLERIHKRGGDPYLGQPLAFDYIFCRLGETPYQRDANLVIDLSVLSFSDLANYHKQVWSNCPLQIEEFGNLTNIPKYTLYLTKGCPQVIKNFLRVYAFTADIIVFSDGIIYF